MDVLMTWTAIMVVIIAPIGIWISVANTNKLLRTQNVLLERIAAATVLSVPNVK